MNCLEARKEFPSFWRRAMPVAVRVSLVGHLQDCAQCDRAFRAFALSAPVVHSAANTDVTESAPQTPLDLMRPRRLTIPNSEALQTWRIAAVAAVLLVAAGITAWSSARLPTQNFDQSVVGESSEVDAGYSSDPAENTADGFAPEFSQFDSLTPDSSELGSTSLEG